MGFFLSVPVSAASSRDKQKRQAGKEASTKSATKQAGPDATTGVAADNATAGTTAAADNHPSTVTAIEKPKRSQCGLEDDKEKWEPYEGPQRIRVTQLSAEDRVKYTALIEQIFSTESINGDLIYYEPMDVFRVMQGVIPYLKSEPMLIEDLPFGINVVGDLQGQLYDLDRVFRGHSKKSGKPGWQCAKYIFLGNYTGEGRQSLDVIMALFCIKMLYPDNIFLLRGNREFMDDNLKSGLGLDLNDRFTKDTASSLFFTCNETFCYLSVAAILGNTYLCVHSGISTGVFTRRAMRGISKPYLYSGDDILVHDLMWSEPCRALRGTARNIRTGNSFLFGCDQLVRALISMQIVGVIRSHTLVDEGYEVCWNLVFSVYTATDHKEAGNNGAIAEVNKHGHLKFAIVKVDENRRSWQRQLLKLDIERDNERIAAREAKEAKEPKDPKETKDPKDTKAGVQ